jgi:outer membrane protein with beta-barrel domain
MRRVVCLLGLVFLFSLGAAAQEVPKVDLFAGYSYVHTSPGIAFPAFTANGGVGSVALNLTNWGSLVVEVGGIHASTINGTDVDATALTYLAGPKISLFHYRKFSPFAQALFGFVNTNPGFNQTTINHNTFAMSPGIGLDWNATRHFGIRLAQVDYLLTRMPTSTNQVNWNNFRYSAGVVFRF